MTRVPDDLPKHLQVKYEAMIAAQHEANEKHLAYQDARRHLKDQQISFNLAMQEFMGQRTLLDLLEE